jgi:hypothetical protein
MNTIYEAVYCCTLSWKLIVKAHERIRLATNEFGRKGHELPLGGIFLK